MSGDQFLMADEQDDSRIAFTALANSRAFALLLSFAAKFKGRYIAALVLMLSNSVLAIYSARLMGTLVEQGLVPKDYERSLWLAGSILLVEVLAILLVWGGRWLLSQAASKTIFSIREHCFEHLQALPLSYYDRQPQGRVVTRVTHDVEGIDEFFSSSMGRLVQAAFMAIVVMVAMLVTDQQLGLWLVLSTVPIFVFSFLTSDSVRQFNRRTSRLSSILNSQLSELISGLDVIRSFGLETWSKRIYDGKIQDHLNAQLASNRLFAFQQPFIAFLCSLPLVVLVWKGGTMVLAGSLSVGIFVAFVRYCERFLNPIMTLARESHIIQQAFTNAERVAAFLAEETEEKVLKGDKKIKQGRLSGEIAFFDVNMSYDNVTPILKNLTFNIRSGEKIGLVGTTGCGKTTTVSLISRLYEYQSGDIVLDGRDLRDYHPDFIRSQIGFVSQDAIIFRGSLRENLTCDEGLGDESILAGAKETGLTKVMRDNGLTLESEILDGGANLSVGERALVALTRVLLNDPAILVLDEATANIDPHFEKLIHDAIHKMMKGRTCLMIAHRLSTLESCDRLLVFEKGRLVEEGPMQELLSRDGYYAKLTQAQLLKPAAEVVEELS
jgi:ABC-type multidrug transport system fused ATPase/permease subunit